MKPNNYGEMCEHCGQHEGSCDHCRGDVGPFGCEFVEVK